MWIKFDYVWVTMGSVRSLQAILFTDIVGSTRRATELGKHGWSELLREHHHRVRREIRRFGGREIKALGDGFLVSFPRPSQAVRCAWAIRESTRELGLEIRSGIHVGEVEHQGSDLSGIPLHVCSRISAVAAPGEILISHAVREMETGAGFRFEDRGKHALEGLPGEWRLHELRGLPAGTASLRTGKWFPEFTGRQLAIGLAVAAVVVSAGLAWRYASVDRSPDNGNVAAEGAPEPAIAVLPFTVNDPELEGWSEGLVTLLSTGLDGAGGLRAIDSPTVLARWDRMTEHGSAGVAHGLEVARAIGARYALVGSATSVGTALRIVGDVYRTDEGGSIGQVQAEGSQDEVLDLVDRLAIGVIRLIVEKGVDELAEIDLEAVTTSSLPALKAFLEGSALYRRSDFVGATEAYERAVGADSTFALAYYHLSQAYGWQLPESWERMIEAVERAARHKDRLPRREVTFVEASLEFNRASLDGLEAIRRATRRYPDDAEGWYWLGEYYFHIPQALASLEDAEAAYRKAVELLPAFAPYRIHLVDLAFMNEPDSARIATELERYAALTSILDVERKGFELAFALAFGDDTLRTKVIASIDTVSAAVRRDAMELPLIHPRFLEDRRILLGEGSPGREFWGELYQRGHLRVALRTAERRGGGPSSFPTCALWEAHVFGIPIPTEVLEAELTLTAADSTPGPRTACGGLYAVDIGRWDDHARAVAILRRELNQTLAEGDSAGSRFGGALVKYFEGYSRWKRGDPRGALPLLQDAFRELGFTELRLLIGQVYMELDRPEEAVRYFGRIWFNPLADYYLGVAFERSGELERARRAYESLVLQWRDPDPELRPLVERSRQAMIRVEGLQRE